MTDGTLESIELLAWLAASVFITAIYWRWTWVNKRNADEADKAFALSRESHIQLNDGHRIPIIAWRADPEPTLCHCRCCNTPLASREQVEAWAKKVAEGNSNLLF